MANEYDFMAELVKTFKHKALTEYVLNQCFPGAVAHWNIAAGNDGGIDLTVSGQHIDVKYRTKDCQGYGDDDLALERFSNIERQREGWTLDGTKRTDWVLWIWLDTLRYELVPFKPLAAAFRKNLTAWMEYPTRSQTTPVGDYSYTSQVVFVPRQVVLDAIEREKMDAQT